MPADPTLFDPTTMFQLLTGERTYLGGCRIVADPAVPLDEVRVYDHRGKRLATLTGLTEFALATGGDDGK